MEEKDVDIATVLTVSQLRLECEGAMGLSRIGDVHFDFEGCDGLRVRVSLRESVRE